MRGLTYQTQGPHPPNTAVLGIYLTRCLLTFRSPTRVPHPLSRGSSTMTSQVSLYSPSDETTRHRGSLLVREASVSTSPIRGVDGSAEGSKRPSSTEEALSETNADALERLVSLRERQSPRAPFPKPPPCLPFACPASLTCAFARSAQPATHPSCLKSLYHMARQRP